jgi:hypothetical protein
MSVLRQLQPGATTEAAQRVELILIALARQLDKRGAAESFPPDAADGSPVVPLVFPVR